MKKLERKDLDQINKWYRLRALPNIDINDLPVIGYIEDHVAAGFLYQTDSQICILGSYVTNPQASRGKRKESLFEISDALIDYARESNFKRIFATTKLDCIEKMCHTFDFKEIGTYKMFLGE